jgi:hypothetical protein
VAIVTFFTVLNFVSSIHSLGLAYSRRIKVLHSFKMYAIACFWAF